MNGLTGECITILNRMVRTDLMEKVKSEQTLGEARGSVISC